jgi:site-specific DNA-adenine methylase
VYVKELSTILREYLAEKYRALHDPHGGSGEVFFTVIQQNVPETLATSISTVLKEIDKVIALEMDTYPELEQFKERVREIIDARRGEPTGENHTFNRIQ